MKKTLKALLLMATFSLGLIASLVNPVVTSAKTKGTVYYVSSPEEEIMQFNRALATNATEFTIIYDRLAYDDYYINLPEEYIIQQDYADSMYGFYSKRQLGWKITESKERFEVEFSRSGRETVEQTKYVFDTIHKLIKDNPSIAKASNYEKAAWAYDWIVDNVKYAYTLSNNSAYDGLTSETACEGYSILFYAFATELGLDCRIACGGTSAGSHAWNIVKLEGKWYAIDTTWGAGGWGRKCFLKSINTFATDDYGNHDLTEEFCSSFFNYAATDYVDKGTSGYTGVKASVYDVEMDTLKKNVINVGDTFNWMISNPKKIALTFKSSDEKVAKVDKNGVITGVAKGTATITVSNKELGIEQKCEITVNSVQAKVVNVKHISVEYKKTAQIKLETSPKDAKLTSVSYKSADTKIAKVNSKGVVTGVRAGKTTIDISYGKNQKVSVPVTVKPAVKKEEATVKVGKTVGLGDAIAISDKGYFDLKFKSSDTKVATVSNTGLVKGIKKGKVTIYIYDKSTDKAVGVVKVSVTK